MTATSTTTERAVAVGATPALRLRLMGVRGSTPTPGRAFARVGGHTSCLAVLPDEGAADRMLVLDAGTGFRDLTQVLGDRPLRADVLLTHLHWDHVQGLPFLPNADRPDAEVDLWIPMEGVRLTRDGSTVCDGGSDTGGSNDARALELLARGFAPPSFPIRPDNLRGDWRFHALGPGRLTSSSREVQVDEVHHKGGRTLGVRVAREGRSFTYLPDHSVRSAPAGLLASAERLARDTDVLLHGAQYLESERTTADAFGHCTAVDAVELAVRTGAARLVLIHHAPHRDDAHIGLVLAEAIDRVRDLGSTLRVEVGSEGSCIDV